MTVDVESHSLQTDSLVDEEIFSSVEFSLFEEGIFHESQSTQKSDGKKHLENPTISVDSTITRPVEIESHSLQTDPLVDEEIFSSVESSFFEEGFNASFHELQKLGDIRLKELIQAEKQKLVRQLTVVSKKVFSVILEKRAAYLQEFNRMLELQDELDNALGFCTSSRLQMASAKETLSFSALTLIHKYRRKQQLTKLLEALEMIKMLQETEAHIHNLIGNGDFAKAIHLLSECQMVIRSFSHFSCIVQLNLKLQDTLVMAEEHLDTALSKMCQSFNRQQYGRLHEAYQSLGKSQVAMDQLLMYISAAVHTSAFTVVRGYAALHGASSETEKLTFKELCTGVVPEFFVPCLIDLCRAMWTLMVNFTHIVKWHTDKIAAEQKDKEVLDTLSTSEEEPSLSKDAEYIKQKLSYGRSRIWHDIQTKLTDFMLSLDVSSFRIEELLQTLDIVRRLMEVGKEFAGSTSEGLQNSLRQQTISYFRSYHASRLEELKVFLDNESWEPCPVRENFSCRHLAEFQFLDDDFYARNNSALSEAESKSFFGEFTEERSPFGVQHSAEDMSFYGRNVCNSVSNIEDPVETENDNPFAVSAKLSLPILCNTTLSLLRLIGRYLQMMRFLQTIAYDVAICLNQLIDYYLFAVAKFFAAEVVELSSLLPNSKLPSVLRKIEENLILKNTSEVVPLGKCKVFAPCLTNTVNLTRPESMVARITAVESVVFLADQLLSFKDELKVALPESRHSALEQFCLQVKSNATDLRHPVFASIARIVVNRDLILAQMNRVSFDIKEVMSQHSPYVDELLMELQSFSTRLGEALSKVSVTPEVHSLIWEHVVLCANNVLLEGYSNVKRCTNEGRALMQLDFRQFSMKMETLTSVRPLPGASLVETYIKAFYIPESAIEEWAREHTEYSEKQLQTLLTIVCQTNKRKILKFGSLMDERK